MIAVPSTVLIALTLWAAAGLLYTARGTTELIPNPRVRLWFFSLQASIAMAGAVAGVAAALLIGLGR